MKFSKINNRGTATTVPEDISVILKSLPISVPRELALATEYLKSVGYVEVPHGEIPRPPKELMGKCKIELGLPKRNGDVYYRTYVFTEIPEDFLTNMTVRNRRKRDDILIKTVDPINAVRWSSFDDAKKEEWIAFRDCLLNITEQEGWPANIIWPAIPK
jgi:hypothetical protein